MSVWMNRNTSEQQYHDGIVSFVAANISQYKSKCAGVARPCERLGERVRKIYATCNKCSGISNQILHGGS